MSDRSGRRARHRRHKARSADYRRLREMVALWPVSAAMRALAFENHKSRLEQETSVAAKLLMHSDYYLSTLL